MTPSGRHAPDPFVPAAPARRVEWVDFLRGVSACAVVLFHVRVTMWIGLRALASGAQYPAFDRAAAWITLPFPLFGSAVMLFFIVSGFAIHYPYAGGRTAFAIGPYARRRFFRIYPTYLAAVLLTLAAERAASGAAAIPTSSWATFAASVAMTQNYVPPFGQMTGNPSLWSLPVEVELYAMYPLLLWFWRRAGTARMLACVCAISAGAAAFLLTGHDWPMRNFAKYWILWTSGAVLAERMSTGTLPSWRAAWWWVAAACVAGVVAGRAFGLNVGYEHFLWGGVYVVLLWWGLAQAAPLRRIPDWLRRPALLVGDLSYSLYLVHFPLFVLLGAWWIAMFGHKPLNVLVPLIASLAPLPLAYLFWRFIERPSQSWGRTAAALSHAGAGDGRLQVLLVGNYPPDGQPSMQRFAALLGDGLAARGVAVSLLQPGVVAGRLRLPGGGLRKWLGYVDKLVIFPWRLHRAARPRDSRSLVVHICDHSNAPYTRFVHDIPHVVTCHDLLAIRSARAEFAETSTRWSGRLLQQSILHGLRSAASVVCDSDATRRDLLRIAAMSPERADVVYPGVSRAFLADGANPASPDVRRWLATTTPYVLHVGGTQWYKNRPGLLRIHAALASRVADLPALVIAGKPLQPGERALVNELGLSRAVIEWSNVSDANLAALYASAAVLLFPSIAEGFGWPVLEAMACGCRVVTSDRAPLTEIGGSAATYVDPADPEGAADVLARVLSEPQSDKAAHVAAGRARAAQFACEAMVDSYIRIYRGVLDQRANATAPDRATVHAESPQALVS